MDNQYQTCYYERQRSGKTKNFKDTSTRLTNNETDLNSTQGYIKAINKLVRSIERANHHTELLTSATEKKTRGLIPKLTPKIPDTPASFIIRWESTQKNTVIALTETLRDHWKERANKLQELELLKGHSQHNGTKFKK